MQRSPDGSRDPEFIRPDPKTNVNDELGFHIERLTSDLIARGLTPAQARAEALRKFGDVDRVRAECERLEVSRVRRRARANWIHEAATDVKYGLRGLLRQPLFTIAAALTLGLGIGANTAIYSAVDAMMLRPIPVPRPEELLVIAATSPEFDIPGPMSYHNFQRLRERRDVFRDVIGFNGVKFSMRIGNGDAEPLFAGAVTSNYFDALGVSAAVGRTFAEAEGERRLALIVLSDRLWERHYQRDPQVIGSKVSLNGTPYTVTGVLPRSFTGTLPLIDVGAYVPVTAAMAYEPVLAGMIDSDEGRFFRTLARVKPGVSPANVEMALRQTEAQLQRELPQANRGLRFVSAPELRSRPDISLANRTPWMVAIFVALVGLLLLVACANVANLLLIRATQRQANIAVRRALGASGGRIVRQLLTESVVLALFGLVVGAVVGQAAVSWVSGLDLSVQVPVTFGLQMNWRVFALASLAAGAAGILAGIAPAVFGARFNLASSLSDAGRTGSAGTSRVRRRVRQALVVAQVAGCVVLLVFAGLFTRSVRKSLSSDLGFRTANALLMEIDLSVQRYEQDRGQALLSQLRERARALPGVRDAVGVLYMPFSGNIDAGQVLFETPPTALPTGAMQSARNVVSDGYFAALGYRITRGREFTPRDNADAPPVVLVNEAFAAKVWPNEDPIGKRLGIGPGQPQAEVVGVVSNSKFLFVNEEPRPFVYEPLAQRYEPVQTLFLSIDAPAQSVAGPLRQIVRELDPGLLVSPVRTIESHLRDGIAFFLIRLVATLAATLGIIALIQALVGLYGILAFAVGLRTRELGLRMALGASRASVLRIVFGEGGVLVGAGLLIGILVSFAGARVARAVLFGVSPLDFLAYGGACLVLAACAAVACYIPARRAARIEPLTALRVEG
jgi:predicted permease